jgi:predicted exporter
MLLCIAVIARTQFSGDLSAFLPRSPSPAQQLLVEQLREGVVSRLILLGIEGPPPAVLAKISTDLAKRLRNEQAFVSVNNGDDAALEKDRDVIWRNRYLLSSAVAPDRFSPAGLRLALEEDLRLLGTPAGMLLKRVLPNDPTGELLHILDELEGQSQPAVREGVWFSQDGNRALLVAQIRAPGSDIDAQQQALALIQNHFASIRGTSGGQDARLMASGPGVFAVSTRERIKADAWRFSLLATVMVASLLLFAYRSPRVVALALLPVVSGALAGVAAVSLGFGSVHGITLGFGVTLIGEAVDYAIYLFTQTGPGQRPHETLPRIWPTLRLGVLTSICGFGAMLLSDLSGLSQLGLFSIVGLVVAVGVTRWLLPTFLPGSFATLGPTKLVAALPGLAKPGWRLQYPLLLLVALAALLLALHSGSLWDDQLSSLSPVSKSDQQLDEALRRDLGAPDLRYLLVVSASSEEQALATAEQLAVPLRGMVEQGTIAGFDSPALYLPSSATQRARQASLPQPEALRTSLQQALMDLPFRSDVFEPFLKDVAAAKVQPLLKRSDLAETGLSLKLDSLLIPRDGNWAAILPLRGVASPQRLAESLSGSQGRPGVVLLDLQGESNQLYRAYLHEALALSLLGCVVIVLLLSASLRSLRRVYEVLMPLAAAVVVTVAILSISGQQLSIFHLIGLLLVVGVGSNYSLFFERQNRFPQERERTVASLILANLCTVIGFGLLSFSHVPVLHGIGMTVGIGAFLSLVFSAILTAPRQTAR